MGHGLRIRTSEVLQVLQAHRVRQGRKAQQVTLELLVLQAHRVFRDQKVTKVPQAHRVQQVLKVLRV
jgi:hypothetical protein